MDPDNGGCVGQIMSMLHDAAVRKLKSTSFESWVIQYAMELGQGKYVYESQLGIWKKVDV
jgi:hypothetical protein